MSEGPHWVMVKAINSTPQSLCGRGSSKSEVGDAAQSSGAAVSDLCKAEDDALCLRAALRCPDKKTAYKKLNDIIISFSWRVNFDKTSRCSL